MPAGQINRRPPSQKRIDRAIRAYGENVRKRREELDLTQDAAALRAGISQSHWSKIERGDVEPSIAQMLRIHVALQTESLETLFGQHPSSRLVRPR